MRQAPDLLEPLIEPEQHRPVPDGDEDIVGHSASELVIDLIRHALDPVDKERVVDMGGVVGSPKLLLRHRHSTRTTIRYTDNVCPIRCNLLDTLRRHIIGDVDAARDPRRCRIRRHRRTRVARRVQCHLVDADMRQLPDEPLCPAILERAGRLTILHLEIEPPPVHHARQQGRRHLAERHPVMDILCIHRTLVQTEQAAALTLKRMRRNGILLFALFTEKVHRNPPIPSHPQARQARPPHTSADRHPRSAHASRTSSSASHA